jgi:ABC-2 type transport system ATP-binding protein
LVGALPLGIQRHVAFAVALAHRPELLVLDEPTSGVGPFGSARLWEQIRAEAERGAGVLVTTHNMEEAEQCDRLVIMGDGSVASQGTAAEIIGGRTITEVRSRQWQRAFSLLEDRGFMVQLHGAGLRVNGPAGEVAALLSTAGITADVAVVAANLEESFVAVVTAGAPTVGSAQVVPGPR